MRLHAAAAGSPFGCYFFYFCIFLRVRVALADAHFFTRYCLPNGEQHSVRLVIYYSLAPLRAVSLKYFCPIIH